MIHRTVPVLLLLAAAGCKDPCAIGAGADPFVRVGESVSNALGAATNPFYTPQTHSQQCAVGSPSPAPETIGNLGDGNPCTVASGDGACIACLKTSCCAEVLACDETCLEAAADAGAYSAGVACGVDQCRTACGGAS